MGCNWVYLIKLHIAMNKHKHKHNGLKIGYVGNILTTGSPSFPWWLTIYKIIKHTNLALCLHSVHSLVVASSVVHNYFFNCRIWCNYFQCSDHSRSQLSIHVLKLVSIYLLRQWTGQTLTWQIWVNYCNV